METYWDLDGPARAKLTREEVEKYEAAELMMKGVLRVKAPELVEVPDIADVPKRTVYAVKSYWSSGHRVGFATLEDAERAFETAIIFDHDHSIRSHVENPAEPEFEAVQVIPHAAAAMHKARLKQAEASREANENARRAYVEACAKQEEALRDLWNDWHECREKDRRHRKVIETFEEYKTIAGGDLAVAARFLNKAFPHSEIEEAAEWCGVTIPAAEPVAAE
jgi:hypothetical protein